MNSTNLSLKNYQHNVSLNYKEAQSALILSILPDSICSADDLQSLIIIHTRITVQSLTTSFSKLSRLIALFLVLER
jgi:hypothetical protein